jgi:hypothetical protein
MLACSGRKLFLPGALEKSQMFNPRWMFHAVHGARIVQTQDDYEALSAGWAESPQEAARLSETPDTSQEDAERLAREQAAAVEAAHAAEVAAQADAVRANLEKAARDAAGDADVQQEGQDAETTKAQELAAEAEAAIQRVLAEQGS